MLKHLFERKQNPLLVLTPNLDITLPYNGSPAILSKEQFNTLVNSAINEAQRIKSLLIPNPEIKEILALSQDERNAKMAAVSSDMLFSSRQIVDHPLARPRSLFPRA